MSWAALIMSAGMVFNSHGLCIEGINLNEWLVQGACITFCPTRSVHWWGWFNLWFLNKIIIKNWHAHTHFSQCIAHWYNNYMLKELWDNRIGKCTDWNFSKLLNRINGTKIENHAVTLKQWKLSVKLLALTTNPQALSENTMTKSQSGEVFLPTEPYELGWHLFCSSAQMLIILYSCRMYHICASKIRLKINVATSLILPWKSVMLWNPWHHGQKQFNQ